MILYHISLDLYHNGQFYPRVPSSASENPEKEDSYIERICVSKTIEGCFTAHPFGGINFSALDMSCGGVYKLFILDTEKLGISPERIIGPEVLVKKRLVQDALITDEHWILDEFLVAEEDTRLIYTSFWSESSEDVIPSDIRKEAELCGIEVDDYVETMGYENDLDCYTVIEDMKVFTNKFEDEGSFKEAPVKFSGKLHLSLPALGQSEQEVAIQLLGKVYPDASWTIDQDTMVIDFKDYPNISAFMFMLRGLNEDDFNDSYTVDILEAITVQGRGKGVVLARCHDGSNSEVFEVLLEDGTIEQYKVEPITSMKDSWKKIS